MWVIHGDAYDFDKFRARHPGGATALDLCRGSDATRLFEQFHVMTEKHRKALRPYLIAKGRDDWAPSAFHDDLKDMLRDHFKDHTHKASWSHLGQLGVVFAFYAWGWRGRVAASGMRAKPSFLGGARGPHLSKLRASARRAPRGRRRLAPLPRGC